MKVLHVIARLNVGGTATYLCNLLEDLERKDITTLLAVGRVPQNEVEDTRLCKLNYQRIEGMSRAISPFMDWRALMNLKRTVSAFNPDIIHSHTFKAGLLTRVLKTKVPIVHTFHGHHIYDPDFNRAERRILGIVEKHLAEKASRLITVGEKIKKELLEEGIGEGRKYISIPPGIRAPKIVSRDSVEIRNLLERTKPNILWMGRLTNVKRPDLMIKVARKLPQYNFVVAGDGELRLSLEISAPKNVFFVGFQKSDEMFSIADLVLLTSESEGMPLTLIEGQMAGIPAVATNVGSIAEIVENGSTGFLTSVDVEEIAERIDFLMVHKGIRLRMGKMAKSRASRLFSIGNMSASHVNLYTELLNRDAA